jgi:hypothetical protein
MIASFSANGCCAPPGFKRVVDQRDIFFHIRDKFAEHTRLDMQDSEQHFHLAGVLLFGFFQFSVEQDLFGDISDGLPSGA